MTGWRRRMMQRVSRFGLAGVAMMTGMAAVAEQQVDEMPSVDLLEFLVEWETDDGQWIDPAELEAGGELDQQPASVEQDHD